MEVGQRPRQVVDRGQEEVLRRARRGLDRGRGERRLAARREDDAVDAGRLGAPQQGPDVLGILEGVEGEDERRLVALDRPGEDVGQAAAGRAATTRATPWCPSKPVRAVSVPPSTSTTGIRRVGGVQDEPLERVAAAAA